MRNIEPVEENLYVPEDYWKTTVAQKEQNTGYSEACTKNLGSIYLVGPYAVERLVNQSKSYIYGYRATIVLIEH